MSRTKSGIELMAKGFASTTDLAEKKITFSEIGTDLYAFTAEGDPNSAIIVGEDGCLVFDAQSTPAMANKVIERVRTVTDKPIKYVVLSHYHAVRVLGASAYKAQGIVASAETHRLIEERGQQDWDSEYGRFPRLFQDAQSIPGLTWPTLTFEGEMSIYLGKREVMDPKFSSFAIYEHCLPFNVSRAFDEASGIDDPVIWTDKRDQEMWAALQGGG